MWIYEKKLEYPVKIKHPNSQIANIVISQLGGPDGELGASMRYLHQRYSCPNAKISGILTDVGTEDKNCAFAKMRKKGRANRPAFVVMHFLLSV